jgi:hypothetical protein
MRAALDEGLKILFNLQEPGVRERDHIFAPGSEAWTANRIHLSRHQPFG